MRDGLERIPVVVAQEYEEIARQVARRIAELIRDLSQAGRDLSTLLGANYVNRFSIQGRSYKVIPQVMRAERLTPDQLEQIYITGSASANAPAVAKRVSRCFSSERMMMDSSCGGTFAFGFVSMIGAGFSVTCLRM